MVIGSRRQNESLKEMAGSAIAKSKKKDSGTLGKRLIMICRQYMHLSVNCSISNSTYK